MKVKTIFNDGNGKPLGFGIKIGPEGEFCISEHYTERESQLMHQADPDLFGPEFKAKYGNLIGINQIEPNHHFSYKEEENKVYMFDSETGEANYVCTGEEFLREVR